MESRSLYYVTNRAHEGDDRWHPTGYGPRVSEDGGENLRFGEVTVQYDPLRVRELLDADSGFGFGDGAELADCLLEHKDKAAIEAFEETLSKDISEARQAKKRAGSARTFAELTKEMRRGFDVLIFVHGFNVSWWEAVASATALELMLNRDRSPGRREVKVLLYTWPSDGKAIPFWSYFSDRGEAKNSGDALGRGFLKLRDYMIEARRADRAAKRPACLQSFHLLCHSMGNFVLENALQRTREFSVSGRPPRLFEQIFLCAADVADDVFEPERPFRSLPELAESVTIYHNRRDLAMPVSDYTKGNSDRLGWRGASRPADLDGRVHQVDCSTIVTGLVQHGYYACGRVNDDICSSINGLSPDDTARHRVAVRNGWPNVWRMV